MPSKTKRTTSQPLVRREIVYALIAVLLILATVAHYWDTLTVWRLHNRAAELSQTSRDDEAIEQLRAALLVDRHDPQTVFMLARSHRRVGDYQAATYLLSTAEELGAKSEQIELERTLLAVQAGQIRGFDQKFSQLIVDMPEQSADIIQAYAIGLFANQQSERAFQLVADWEATTPQDPQPKFLQAYLFQESNHLDLAADAYRAGLKLSEDAPLMRRRLGQVLLTLGKADEALVELKKCLQASPDDVEVHYLLAQGAQQQNELDTALQELDGILATSPIHFGAQRLRGRIYLDKGEPHAAIADLQGVVTAHPDDTVAREALGRAMQALGRNDEARVHFDFVAATTKYQHETDRLLRQMVEEPKNADLPYETALRLIQSGNLEDGAKWLRTALELQPDHTAAQLALADVLESLGDVRNASLHRQAALQSGE